MKRANSTEASPSASIPSVPLPRAPDPQVDPAAYLRSIYAVRERTRLVLEKAKRNQLRHFTVDMSKFPDTAAYVVSIIKVPYTSTHTHTPSAFWLAAEFHNSETLIPTTPRFRPTADGSTLRSAAFRESTNSCARGPAQSTIGSEPDASLTSSWFPSCWMLAQERNGNTNQKRVARYTGVARALQWPVWRCSRRACSPVL